MITRKSFFIRWLKSTGDEQNLEHSVIEIQHIQSGCKQCVSTLEEANQWMRDAGKKDEQPRIKEIE